MKRVNGADREMTQLHKCNDKEVVQRMDGPYIVMSQRPQNVAVTLLKGVIVQNRSDQSSRPFRARSD